MSDPDLRPPLGFVGGTGPLGRGLATRWSEAGHPVHIGSRSRDRAAGAVEDVAGRVGDEAVGRLHAATNGEAAAAAEVVVVTVPYRAQQAALPPLADAVGDKIVLNVVNPMEFDDAGPKAVPVEAGSAAEECQQLLPDARVVSGFHDVSSKRLLQPDEPIETHVLICGDDHGATHRVAHLASRIEGMWAVYCGPLRNSQHIENLTPVILFINQYYDIQAGLLIDGIQAREGRLHAHRADAETAGS